MYLNEIAECCNAIVYLRKLINNCCCDRHDYIEFSSDLFMYYNDLSEYMEKEERFLNSIRVK